MAKHIMRGVCTLILSLSLAVTALAAAGGHFLRGSCMIEGNTLRMLCAELPEGGNLTATAGTQEIPAALSTVAEKKLTTTVYCLVDVSSSMGAAQMQTAKDTMMAISGQMGDGDNMVITTLGDTVSIGQVLETAQAREDTIAALGGEEYTNLYAGIVDSLKELETSTVYNQNRCLVILSDGKDDHRTGSTEDEAMDAVKNSSIPIYAVATLYPGAGREAQEYGKLLRSFSSASLGGLGYTPTLDDLTGTEIGQDIWRSIQASGVIDIDFTAVDVPADRDTLMVKVTYRTGDAEYVDTATVYTVDLPTPTPSPTPSSTPTPTPTEPSPGPGPGPTPPKPTPFVWIIVAAALLITAIATIAILLIRKKKRPDDEQKDLDEKQKDSDEADKTFPLDPHERGLTGRPPASVLISIDSWTPSAPTQADCRVRLTALHHPERVFDIDLLTHQGMTVGRDGRASTVLGEDSKLSGLHCELEWDGAALYVQDLESTNGTFVNGVPIRGKSWMPLEDGSTLRIGAYEYRVKYTRKG